MADGARSFHATFWTNATHNAMSAFGFLRVAEQFAQAEDGSSTAWWRRSLSVLRGGFQQILVVNAFKRLLKACLSFAGEGY